MKRTFLKTVTTAVALSILVGCSVGPDYHRPDLQVEVPESWAAASGSSNGQPLELTLVEHDNTRWWETFDDSTLDSLVNLALIHNNDLAAAAGRVREAQALVGGAAANQWPSIEIGGTASRNKSANLNFPSFISPYLSSFSTSATVRYEADLWGRLARGKESAVASLLANKNDRLALARSVVAQVVRARLEAVELTRQLDLARATIANNETNLQVVKQRYHQGLATALDVDMATQNLASAKASEFPLRQQRAVALRRLEILCGSYPAGRSLPDHPEYAALPSIPGGLPSMLLDRRPDLQAAELRLHAAVAQVGQAKAALFPRISLTASSGFSSRDLADLGKSGTDVWSLVGNLVMPLVNRGATKAQIKTAEARAAQSAASYRNTVLAAFAEVENALDRDQFLALQAGHLAVATTSAQSAAHLAEDRYRRGLDNILVMLETQRRAFATESQFLTISRQRQTARVDLILALGGPWDITRGPDDSNLFPAQITNQGVQQ